MKSEDLMAVVDFIYLGETNVQEENLNTFMSIAEELQLKGLTGEEGPHEEIQSGPEHKTKVEEKCDKNNERQKEKQIINSLPVALLSPDLNELDEKINSLMVLTELSNGQGKGFACQICGKEAILKNQTNMKDHIEANHIQGVSRPCNLCEKTFR